MTSPVTAVWDAYGAEHEADLQEVDLVSLLTQLDGNARTLVTVLSGEGHAACGGDARTGVVMYVTFDGDRFHQLISGSADDDSDRWVVAGGQAGTYPARCVVSVDAASAALSWYADRDELLPTARWESS
jgi:hypothetical protein